VMLAGMAAPAGMVMPVDIVCRLCVLVESLKGMSLVVGSVFGGGIGIVFGVSLGCLWLVFDLSLCACRLRKGVLWIVSRCKSVMSCGFICGLWERCRRVVGEWWHEIHLPVHYGTV
jgi:hypothetical protein